MIVVAINVAVWAMSGGGLLWPVGVLDVQGEELRRIERDLHDGAQARLVA